MRRRKPDRTGLFFGSNPDRSGAAHQSEGIVADQLRRALQVKLDGIVREWPDGVKFIGHAENHASGVSPVCNQAGVIRQKRKLLINALARILLHDNLLALNVALETQVSPFVEELA